MESGSDLKTTITGDIQIEIIGGAFFVGKIVLMSGLAIRGQEETAKVFSLAVRVHVVNSCTCCCGARCHR